MGEGFNEHIYKKEDIEKAYDMGWENAIIILEKSIGMSLDSQKELLNMLKKMRSENRADPLSRQH
jgi:hypothetical protein